MGFAKPEIDSVMFVAIMNKINIEEYADTSPRNWIPKGRRKPLIIREHSKKRQLIAMISIQKVTN